jgi:hypothetical protein
MGTGMPDLCLKVSSDFGLLDLAFAESFGFLLDGGRHHCELTIVGIMVVESIGVRYEVHINAVRLVDNECAFALTAVGDMKLLANVLQREDVGNGIRVIPDSPVVCNVGFHVCGQSPTIDMDSH